MKGADLYYEDLVQMPEALSPYKTDLWLKIRFEHLYGIRNHDAEVPDVPFPYAAIDPIMDPAAVDPKYDMIRRFAAARVNELFCSYSEFLRLPVDMAESLLETAENIMQEKVEVETEAANRIREEERKQALERDKLNRMYTSGYTAHPNKINYS